jgi:hypothetical protein
MYFLWTMPVLVLRTKTARMLYFYVSVANNVPIFAKLGMGVQIIHLVFFQIFEIVEKFSIGSFHTNESKPYF